MEGAFLLGATLGIFAPAIKAMTIEGPWPLTSKAILDYLGGPPSTSGVKVNYESAMSLAAVWACVRLLAETVSSIPLPVYRRLNPGKERATDHPLYRLLHDEPNPWMTSLQFRETLQGHVLLRGNAYARIERDEFGQPRALWPLHPDCITDIKTSGSGLLLYTYVEPDGREVVYPQTAMFHLRGLASDGIWGYSPIRVHRETIGLALAEREAGSRYFGQGSRPSGILKTKNKLSKEAADRLAASWARATSGLSNFHTVPVAEDGLEFQQLGLSQEDSQYIESRRFSVSEVARIFGVQPHKIGDLSNATFSNIEHQAIEFVTDTVRPWLVRWEQQLAKDLFLPRERATYFPEFVVEGLLRGDLKTRYDAYATGRQNGWLNADEIREIENMNPLPDGAGQDYWMPVNVVPAGTEPNSPQGVAA